MENFVDIISRYPPQFGYPYKTYNEHQQYLVKNYASPPLFIWLASDEPSYELHWLGAKMTSYFRTVFCSHKYPKFADYAYNMMAELRELEEENETYDPSDETKRKDWLNNPATRVAVAKMDWVNIVDKTPYPMYDVMGESPKLPTREAFSNLLFKEQQGLLCQRHLSNNIMLQGKSSLIKSNRLVSSNNAVMVSAKMLLTPVSVKFEDNPGAVLAACSGDLEKALEELTYPRPAKKPKLVDTASVQTNTD